jgi:hypothetical protein
MRQELFFLARCRRGKVLRNSMPSLLFVGLPALFFTLFGPWQSAPRSHSAQFEELPFMAFSIKRKEVAPVQSVPSTLTSRVEPQRGIPEEIVEVEKPAQYDTVHDDALRLYSRSAAELSLIAPTESRGCKWHQYNIHDLKEAQDRLEHEWHLSKGKNKTEVYYEHLTSQFGGGIGRKWPHKYTRPSRALDQEQVTAYFGDSDENGRGAKRPFLNPFGQIVWKYEDVDTYISPSNSIPRRLIVQATEACLSDTTPVSWRRTKIKGTVPLALRMAEWALHPKLSRVKSAFRQAVVALPLQALLALPGANAPWEMTQVKDSYHDYPGYHWKWPKHAINPLDTREDDRKRYQKPEIVSSKQRLHRPRQLVVFKDGEWKAVKDPPKDLQYVFVSYHWDSFKGSVTEERVKSEDKVDIMAQYICRMAGLTAYFSRLEMQS